MQKCLIDEADFKNLFGMIIEKLEEREVQKFVAVARQPWFCRNSVVFKGIMSPPEAVVHKAMLQVDYYDKARQAKQQHIYSSYISKSDTK